MFYSRGGDCPESICMTTMDLSGDWRGWPATLTPPDLILAPEEAWEGVHERLTPSNWGAIHGPARQLRDPCLFDDEGRLYLYYSVAGEQGIAGATLEEE